MTRFAGAPTLLFLYGGRFSRDTQENKTDDDIVASALGVLETIHGNPIPTPTETRVTRWTTDPYSLGSYSFIPAGASPDDMRQLAEPVAGRVLFAGEATYFEYHATVHGAMMSGMREATRLGTDPNTLFE